MKVVRGGMWFMALCACPMKVAHRRYMSYEGDSWRYVHVL